MTSPTRLRPKIAALSEWTGFDTTTQSWQHQMGLRINTGFDIFLRLVFFCLSGQHRLHEQMCRLRGRKGKRTQRKKKKKKK